MLANGIAKGLLCFKLEQQEKYCEEIKQTKVSVTEVLNRIFEGDLPL